MCTIWVQPGSTIFYRYVVDGIEQFDPEKPCKLRGTVVYNIISAPKTQVDAQNGDELDELDKAFNNDQNITELANQKGKSI